MMTEAMPTPVGQFKQLCWHTMHIVLGCMFLTTSVQELQRTLAAGTGVSWLLAARCAWVLGALYLLAMGLILWTCAYCSKLNRAKTADVSLVFLCSIPFILATVRVNDPHMENTSWVAHFAFCNVVGGMVDLTPLHTVVQLLVVAPCLGLLQLYDVFQAWATCQQAGGKHGGVCDAPCLNAESSSTYRNCSYSSLAGFYRGGHLTRYLLTQLPISLACLCISAIVPAIVFLVHQKRLQSVEEVQDEGGKANKGHRRQGRRSDRQLPLESLGLHVLSGLGLRGPLLWLEHWLELAAGACSEDALVRLVCAPVGIYYLGLALAGRNNIAVRQVAMDEWILAMGVWFMLGRESCKLDIIPFLAQARAHVQASQAVLTDLLPVHIVHVLLGTTSGLSHSGSGDVPDAAVAADPDSGAYADDPNLDAPMQASKLRCHDLTTDPSSMSVFSSDQAGMGKSAATMSPQPSFTSGRSSFGEALASFMSPAFCSTFASSRASSDAFQLAGAVVSAPPGRVSEGGTSSSSGRLRIGRIEEGGCMAMDDRQSPSLVGLLNSVLPSIRTAFSCPIGPGKARTAGSTPRCVLQQPGSDRLSADDAAGRKPPQPQLDVGRPSGSGGRPSGSGGRPSGSSSRPSGSGNPIDIAHKLKLAEAHDCVTVFFSDICGFSTWAHQLGPDKVMNTLNDLYTRLDDILITDMTNLYKIETIGDAYMVVSNLSAQDPMHAADMVRFALRARQEAALVPRPDLDDGTSLQLRIGLHSGPAVSGIVGKLRRRFCMFGDTVNLASRTETTCPVGSIQISAVTHGLAAPHLSSQEAVFVDRGEVELKGAQHPMRMFLVEQPEALDTEGAADVHAHVNVNAMQL